MQRPPLPVDVVRDWWDYLTGTVSVAAGVATALAFIYAALVVGGDAVGLTGVSSDLVFALVGITLLLATTGDAIARFRLVWTRVRGRAGRPSRGGPPGEDGIVGAGADR